MPKKDGRGQTRVLIEEEVRIFVKDWETFRKEHSGDISEGGIFIKTKQPLSPGTLFDLSIHVAGEEIHTRAQVIWTKEFSPGEKRETGMGARFVEIDENGLRLIQRFISEQVGPSD